MQAYYNEHDPHAAKWLENLIAAGEIAPGIVDTRSITDVKPDEIKSYTQVHFFAGIGGWSLALRLAGVADETPVWTGSCPCQPFSAAGKQKGAADERHLWPEMFRLVRECKPQRVFGEQVSSAIRHGWLDGVFADMEGQDYACGAAVLGAHSVGAPHIRQRLYWVADSDGRNASAEREQCIGQQRQQPCDDCPDRIERGTEPSGRSIASGRGDSSVGNTSAPRLALPEQVELPGPQRNEEGRATQQPSGSWSDFALILCRDKKVRRVSPEPGVFPLAYGIPRDLGSSKSKLERMAIRAARTNRVQRLRSYGNAIVPELAAEFIRAFLEANTCNP